MRNFIEECLDRKPCMRVTYRTPPLHRHGNFRAVQVYLQVGNVINDVGGAFDGSAVDSAFDGVLLKRRPFGNRLPDDCVGPEDRIAARIQARDEAVMPHGPVPTSLQIVFAGPHNSDRGFGGLGHVNGFYDKVRIGISAPAESSPQQGGMNLNLLWCQSS